MNKKNRKILIFLSFLGLLDSLYLFLPYISKTTTFCLASSQNSCDMVLNSKYATSFFGIPNSLLGILFYLTLFLIFVYWEKLIKKIDNILKISIFLTTIAVVVYVYFIYLQKFIIKAYCPYCLASAFITFLIWIILIKIYLKK